MVALTQSAGHTYSTKKPQAPVAIVFGAARPSGTQAPYFATAFIQQRPLLRRKSKKLLLSGDNRTDHYKTRRYDSVRSPLATLTTTSTLDYAGLRTRTPATARPKIRGSPCGAGHSGFTSPALDTCPRSRCEFLALLPNGESTTGLFLPQAHREVPPPWCLPGVYLSTCCQSS